MSSECHFFSIQRQLSGRPLIFFFADCEKSSRNLALSARIRRDQTRVPRGYTGSLTFSLSNGGLCASKDTQVTRSGARHHHADLRGAAWRIQGSCARALCCCRRAGAWGAPPATLTGGECFEIGTAGHVAPPADRPAGPPVRAVCQPPALLSARMSRGAVRHSAPVWNH